MSGQGGMSAAMPEVIVALDAPSRSEALELVSLLGEDAESYKVGLELFSRAGPEVVRELAGRGKGIFLDLKLHDIPNTVAGAVRAAADLEVDMLTVHSTGGRAMLEAAVEASRDRVRLLGVTVLTSFAAADVEETWGRSLNSVREEVIRLAGLARDAGLHGVVASPLEAEPLRRRFGPDFLLATPGIRLAGDEAHDQSRVTTPGDATRAGADVLVVGRTVTGASDPREALRRVRAEVADAAAGQGGRS